MVYYMRSALAAGYNVSPKDVVEQVKKDYIYSFKSILGNVSEDQIEMLLAEGYPLDYALGEAQAYIATLFRAELANLSRYTDTDVLETEVRPPIVTNQS
jgi:hypothetical protein